MSWWTDFRDVGETIADPIGTAAVGNVNVGNSLHNLGESVPGNNFFAGTRLGQIMTGGVAAGVQRNNWRLPFGHDTSSFDDIFGAGTSGSPTLRNVARGAGATMGIGAIFGAGAGAEAGAGEGTSAGAGAGYTAEGEGGNAAYYGGDAAGAGAGGASADSEMWNTGPGEAASMDPESWGATPFAAPGGSSFGWPSLSAAAHTVGIGSSMYGLYLAEQARRERQKQLQRQRAYQDQLNDLIAHPERVTQLPGYKFRQQQGEEAVARRMASLGYGAGSGNLGTSLVRYGQDYATGELERQEGLLAQLYGMSGPSINVRDPYEMASRSLGSLGYGAQRF